MKTDYLPPDKDAVRFLQNLPYGLRQQDRWVGFKLIPVPGEAKPKKIPFVGDSPAMPAKCDDPSTWRSFDKARAGLKRGEFTAIAYALGDGIVGIDIDGCIDSLGNLLPDTVQTLKRLQSYSEFSISKMGIHILVRGKIDRSRKGKIEIYRDGRFFIVTGRLVPGYPFEIQNNQQALDELMRENTGVSESLELLHVMTSDNSNDSDTIPLNVQEVIKSTLPRQEGQRNACLFEFARGLKFDLNLESHSLERLKPYVRQWHGQALPFIATKPFDDTWSDFIRAWPTARHGLKDDILKSKWEEVQRTPPLPVEKEYDTDPVRFTIRLCYLLSRDEPNRVFFLSSYILARLLDIPQPKAWAKLEMLVADGILKKTTSGNRLKANRFQWTATQSGPDL